MPEETSDNPFVRGGRALQRCCRHKVNNGSRASERFRDVNAKRTPKSCFANCWRWINDGACNAAGQNFRRIRVDKNRTEGTKHEIKGAVKEVVGKVTGNTGKQVAGNVEKNAGKLQKEVGKAADEQRDADKKTPSVIR
jgi:uncharacterized protein YjbJ (UPF0337 family)